MFACWVGSACVNQGCVSKNCFTPASSFTPAFCSVVHILVFLKSIYQGWVFSLAIAAAPKTSQGNVGTTGACVFVLVFCCAIVTGVNGHTGVTVLTGAIAGEMVVFCPLLPCVVVVVGVLVNGSIDFADIFVPLF